MTDISIPDFLALVRQGLPWVAQLDIAVEHLERGSARVRLRVSEGINRPGDDGARGSGHVRGRAQP